MSFGKLRFSWGENGNRQLSNPYIALANLGSGAGGKYGYINSAGNTIDYVYLLMSRLANPNLKWEKSAELNIGIEGRLLQNRLRGEINYFHERRWDIIGTNSSHYTDMIGDYLYAENRTEVKNQGVEASISWFDSPIKDFSYEVGLNLTFSKNKLIKADELDNIEDYRKKIGQPTDHIFGLQAEGLFGKDIPLNGHAPQSFGPYQNGDIAYADLN